MLFRSVPLDRVAACTMMILPKKLSSCCLVVIIWQSKYNTSAQPKSTSRRGNFLGLFCTPLCLPHPAHTKLVLLPFSFFAANAFCVFASFSALLTGLQAPTVGKACFFGISPEARSYPGLPVRGNAGGGRFVRPVPRCWKRHGSSPGQVLW